MAGTTLHVSPRNDLIEHETNSDGCVCGPTIEFHDGDPSWWMAVHHSLDGREGSEPTA